MLLAWLGDPAAGVTGVLAVFGILLYAVLRIAYSVFYSGFGLKPDDLGKGYLDLLVQSAVGIVLLFSGMLLAAALIVTLAAAKSSKSERIARGFGAFFYLFGVYALVQVLSGHSVTLTGRPRFSALGVVLAGLLLVLLLTVRKIADGLRGDRARQSRREGIVAVAALVLVIAIVSLLGRAAHDRSQVWSGHPAAFTVLDFPVTSWGAEDATFSWTSGSIAAELMPLADRCLLYFGQSGGTAFFYRADTHQVLRISTADIVVHTGPGVCKR